MQLLFSVEVSIKLQKIQLDCDKRIRSKLNMIFLGKPLDCFKCRISILTSGNSSLSKEVFLIIRTDCSQNHISMEERMTILNHLSLCLVW